MAKLDEITELLTDELEGLKQMLVQLKTLTKELTGSETVKDISSIRYELKELNKTQEDHFKRQDTRTLQIEEQLKKSQIIPEWLLFMVSLILIISLSISGYLGYQVVKFEEEKVKAFEEGKAANPTELNSYFKEHPDIYKDFLIWSKNEVMPGQK